MRNTYWFVLLTFILGFVACTEDRLGDRADLQDGLSLSLSVPQNTVVSPMTKAGQEDTKIVSDLNILIYNSGETNALPVKSYYYTTSEEMKGLSASNTSANPVTFNFPLSNGSYSVRVVANAGSEMSGMTCAEVDAKTFGYKNDGSIYMAMYGSDDVTVANGRGGASISLERIYAMITVQVQKSLAADIDITPTQVELIHVPATGCLTGTNAIGTNCLLKDGTGGFVKSDLSADHATAIPLYMYENMQPDGKCSATDESGNKLSEMTSPALGYDKTPASFSKPISQKEIIATDQVSSYIEVTANYRRDGSSLGTIKYRFFLGKNSTTNFEVQRNHHYKITLMLGGQGGKDEVSWRVDADMEYEISTSDIYIGYLDKSTGTVTVTTKDGDLLNSLRLENDNSNGITLSGPYGTGNTRTFVATAQQTNLMQDAYKTGSFKITANFKNGATNSKTVKVSQVSRLVDPIAIYKRAANVEPVDVKVKEYTRGDLDYHILKSDGPWSLKIEKGDWFTLSSGTRNISGEGQVLESTESGDVRFTYTPNSPNPVNDYDSNGSYAESDKARYGVVLIKYHNNNCEHRIYLRQGYHPTTMSGSNVAWSMFNCIGNGSSDRRTGGLPTQTGYFYQAGNNTRYHPYSPGFLQAYGGNYSTAVNSVSSWIGNSDTPCPAGYKLPAGSDYDNVVSKNSLLQGFVHDEDPIAGWTRSSGKISFDDCDEGVHCNPAKGTLVVDKNSGKSLFFSFGKGVLTSHEKSYSGGEKISPTDINLDEIGVGLRCAGDGRLVYKIGENASTDRYGAIYLTSTKSTNGDAVVSIDLWYAMTSPTDHGSVIYNPPGSKDAGFVRCVRDRSSGSGDSGGDIGGGTGGDVEGKPGGKYIFSSVSSFERKINVIAVKDGYPANILGFFKVDQENRPITQILSDSRPGNPPVTIDSDITDVLLQESVTKEECFCTVSELYGNGDKIFK
ncbi:fimbrial protein [uncultured Parabacteroides sp.]|uniref:DUF4906 domain-containing protein n=1 Tax=uncultured Parabacteroides sp. TaxID=512312 RepID=UPI0025F46E53|nr:fimbrial protein [uncultured Parabacteroides sp.]